MVVSDGGDILPDRYVLARPLLTQVSVYWFQTDFFHRSRDRARDWWRETSFTVLESSFNYNIYMYSNIFDLNGQRLLLYIALSMIRKKLFDSSVSQNNKQIILPSEA